MYGDTVILLKLSFYSVASNERCIFALKGKGKAVFDVLCDHASLVHRSATESRAGTLFQKVVYAVNVFLKMGETVARNMYSKLKRISKTNFAASCWLLISL